MTIKDKQIWEIYTRDVKAAPRKPRKTSTAKAAAEKTAAREAAEKMPLRLPKLNSENQSETSIFHTLERKREKSLRQGEIEIDAELDLHGMTQAEAFAALADFMRKKVEAGKRHLLIVTGKGRSGEGVLRGNLKNWLG